MKDIEIYQDKLEEGTLSPSLLIEIFRDYERQILELSASIPRMWFTNDELIQKFYKELDEEALLSFESNEKFIVLNLTCYHEYDGKMKTIMFYACYSLEERNLQTMELISEKRYLFNQEEEMVSALKNLGYQE